MKRILTVLTLALSLFSCKKEKVTTPQDAYLHIEFSVGEQESVSRYEVEVSSNGVEWTTRGVVLASINMEDNYTIDVRVSDIIEAQGYVFTRVRAIDIDGKETYSGVTKVHKN